MEQRAERRTWRLAARLISMFCPIAFVCVAATSVVMAAGPFAGFSGSWGGSGTITFKNGASERIRCRAQYDTSNGDNALEQTLRCASASYQFELKTDIRHSNGTISGSWKESTNDVSGSVSGQASDGRIRAFVSGAGLSASVAVSLSANAQALTMRPQDQRVREVAIQMRRN